MVLLIVVLSLQVLLMEQTAAITYRCDDDQILVVQSFGNDTIRMHCQKPTLCGYQFLKCHYEPLQPYCGGKNNLVAHVQQLTPVGPVTHTCCNLTLGEDQLVPTHTGNDCFLYDLPDGSNGTAAEEAVKEDEEGYTLLKNVNKIPEQFDSYSGYRLRLYLLRNKQPSQMVVKGIERNDEGYRVTICRPQCTKSAEEEKEVAHEEHQPSRNKEDGGVIDGSGTKRIELTLQNLTDDGRWIVAAWTEWSYRQWSQWSRLQWTEFDKLQGTKVRGDRRRIHEVDAGQGVGSDSEEKYNHRRHKNRKHGHAGGQESGKGLRAPVRHRIVVDEGENGVDVPSDQPVPGEVKAKGTKTATQVQKGHRGHRWSSSSECDEDHYYYDSEEEDKNEIGHEEEKRSHRRKGAVKSSKTVKDTESSVPGNLHRGSIATESIGVERKEGSVAIRSGEGGKEEKSSNSIQEASGKLSSEKGDSAFSDKETGGGGDNETSTGVRQASSKSRAEGVRTDISTAKEDEGKSEGDGGTLLTSTGDKAAEKDISKAKEDEGDKSSTADKMPATGKGSEGSGEVQKVTIEKSKIHEGRKHPALDTVDPEYVARNVPIHPEKSSATKETVSKEFLAKETITSGSISNSASKESKESKERSAEESRSKAHDSTSSSKETVSQKLTETVISEDKSTKNLVKTDSKESSGSSARTSGAEGTKAAKGGDGSAAAAAAATAAAAVKKESGASEVGAPNPIAPVAAKAGAAPTVLAGAVHQAAAGSDAAGVVRAGSADVRMNCFSADTKVYTRKGEKTMKELEVGEYVLVPASKNQLRYERVEMFYHREPEKRAKFVVLETESGRKLSLTELHLIPLGDCQEMHRSMDGADSVDEWLRRSRFAHKARVGDCVLSVAPNNELQVDRILKVGRQYLKGIYSPMTVEGSIVTDGILASCFSQVESHFGQKLVYDFLISLRRVFGRVMQSLDEPIQHLPSFIDSVHELSRYVVPFAKY